MFATPSRFAETHPGIRIEWEARSLQGFADKPIRHLAEQYDLIVLDHPFMGTVARDGYLIPLDKHVSAEVLATLRTESVGASHDSYFYDGHQWALAIDAAAQVAGYRPDLLKAASATVPKTWHEVFALARVGARFRNNTSAVSGLSVQFLHALRQLWRTSVCFGFRQSRKRTNRRGSSASPARSCGARPSRSP